MQYQQENEWNQNEYRGISDNDSFMFLMFSSLELHKHLEYEVIRI